MNEIVFFPNVGMDQGTLEFKSGSVYGGVYRTDPVPYFYK